jgi:hypothetical protein
MAQADFGLLPRNIGAVPFLFSFPPNRQQSTL